MPFVFRVRRGGRGGGGGEGWRFYTFGLTPEDIMLEELKMETCTCFDMLFGEGRGGGGGGRGRI